MLTTTDRVFAFDYFGVLAERRDPLLDRDVK